MLVFPEFRVLTFDCYGTLVDWETGILAALQPVLHRHEIFEDEEKLLELYARFESEIESGAFRPYREVLRGVMDAFARHFSISLTGEERDVLVNSLPGWPPFRDTRGALGQLAQHFKLAVISNVDVDLFAKTEKRLGVKFHWVITAQEVGSYKPSLQNFQRALDVIGEAPERVLHVAQSLYHDIAPAKKLGLSTVWVNRRKGKTGTGATPPAEARPDLEVANLAELAAMIEKSFR